MHAVMTVFVDELLWGETDGFRTVDHSKSITDPDRVFWLKTIMLFWVGDYPGMGKCAAMKHAGAHGCHWCEAFFFAHSPGHNVAIHNRRNLRANHPYRTDPRWGAPEHRPPIQNRTHEGVKTQAQDIHDMPLDNARDQLRTKTGIDGFCLFMLLHKFDIVWDMLPDMMHITKGMLVIYALFNSLFMHYLQVLCYTAIITDYKKTPMSLYAICVKCRFVATLFRVVVQGREGTCGA